MVARLVRDQKAAGSNPATSTQKSGHPLWVVRIFVCRWQGFGHAAAAANDTTVSPVGCSPTGERELSLLARKGERSPLQGLRATIERTVSNPATSSAGSVDFPTLPGFAFSGRFSAFSGMQPPGLQRGGEAPISASKNPLP